MTNVPLMFQPLIKYADFQGRARRSEFWLWVLFRIILGIVLSSVMMSLVLSQLGTLKEHPEMFMSNYFMLYPLLSVVNLGLLIPTLAVGVRRLHDINRTGWWIIMPYVVAFAGMMVFFVFFGTSLFQLIAQTQDREMTEAEGIKFATGFIGTLFLSVILPSLIAWVVMLVFYVTEGTRGPNRFGDDPKSASTPLAAFEAPEEMA